MAFVPAVNTVLAEMRMLFDGQRIENTLWFFNPAGPDASNMTALASDLEGWWVTNCAPLLPVDVLLNEIVVTDMTTNTGLQVTNALSGPAAGTLGQAALPNNVTMAVSFRTALRGRSFRGRNYIPALTEGQVTNNTVNGSVADAWRAAYQDILTTVAGGIGGWVWAVVSRFSGVDGDGDPIPRPTAGVIPITTVVVTDTTIDSMRRRLPGRGR